MDRKLFWTDRGSDNGVLPKIASADMDGGNLKNLFTEKLVNVGYITTDISASKLYWGVAGTGVVCSHLISYHTIPLYLYCMFYRANVLYRS